MSKESFLFSLSTGRVQHTAALSSVYCSKRELQWHAKWFVKVFLVEVVPFHQIGQLLFVHGQIRR